MYGDWPRQDPALAGFLKDIQSRFPIRPEDIQKVRADQIDWKDCDPRYWKVYAPVRPEPCTAFVEAPQPAPPLTLLEVRLAASGVPQSLWKDHRKEALHFIEADLNDLAEREALRLERQLLGADHQHFFYHA